MKTTTKIFIASIAALFAIAVLYVFYLAHLANADQKIDYRFDDEMTSIDIPSAKIICINSLHQKEGKTISLRGHFGLHQHRGDGAQMKINKDIAPYVRVEKRGETLFVNILSDSLLERFSQSERTLLDIYNTKISLPADSSIILRSRLLYLGCQIKGMTLKDIDIQTLSGGIIVNSNDIETLTTRVIPSDNWNVAYEMENNKIKTFNFNLDYITTNSKSLIINDNKIRQINYTRESNRDHALPFPYIPCDTMNWVPQENKTLIMEFSKEVSLVRKGFK